MTGNLFANDAAPNPKPAATTKPALAPVPDERTKQLKILTMTLLGLDAGDRQITALEQDGRDPEDATYTIVIDNTERVTLQGVSTLMSRPKVRDILLVRLGVSPAPMKAAEWQDTIAGAIAQAVTVIESSESISRRAQEWVTQYLELEPATKDRTAALLERNPWADDDNVPHIYLARLAKYVARNSTEQITERRLAAALRDAGWTQRTLSYFPEGNGPDGKPRGRRTSVSYYQAPTTPDTEEAP